MFSLVFVLVSLTLFGGFLLLTRYETRQGVRFFARERSVLDGRVERLSFIAKHVDFESFTREQFQILVGHIAHDVAHYSLLAVRALERPLTRMVRELRSRHGIVSASNAAPRAFVKTMSEFKQHLATTRPPVPEL